MLVVLGVGRQPGTGEREMGTCPGLRKHSSTVAHADLFSQLALEVSVSLHPCIPSSRAFTWAQRVTGFFYFLFLFSPFFPSPLFSSLCPLPLPPSLLFLFPLSSFPPSHLPSLLLVAVTFHKSRTHRLADGVQLWSDQIRFLNSSAVYLYIGNYATRRHLSHCAVVAEDLLSAALEESPDTDS